jgi:hypothetical protein
MGQGLFLDLQSPAKVDEGTKATIYRASVYVKYGASSVQSFTDDSSRSPKPEIYRISDLFYKPPTHHLQTPHDIPSIKRDIFLPTASSYPPSPIPSSRRVPTILTYDWMLKLRQRLVRLVRRFFASLSSATPGNAR